MSCLWSGAKSGLDWSELMDDRMRWWSSVLLGLTLGFIIAHAMWDGP